MKGTGVVSEHPFVRLAPFLPFLRDFDPVTRVLVLRPSYLVAGNFDLTAISLRGKRFTRKSLMFAREHAFDRENIAE